MALVSLTAFLREQMPLSATLSMRADQLFPEKVVLSIDWAAELCTSGGVLHGGVIMSVAGSAAALYPFLNLPQGARARPPSRPRRISLPQSATEPLRPPSQPMHVGSRTIVVETDVCRADGRPVAKVIQTQAIL